MNDFLMAHRGDRIFVILERQGPQGYDFIVVSYRIGYIEIRGSLPEFCNT
jgi:hypothetical protein